MIIQSSDTPGHLLYWDTKTVKRVLSMPHDHPVIRRLCQPACPVIIQSSGTPGHLLYGGKKTDGVGVLRGW
eukprot:181424-Pelagomonas_calceolata.AAC.1